MIRTWNLKDFNPVYCYNQITDPEEDLDKDPNKVFELICHEGFALTRNPIRSIPCIPGLIKLDCSNCPNLEEIFIIPGLKQLICRNCPLLVRIPAIQGLELLICDKCPKLIELPKIKMGEIFNTRISCIYCTSLVSIPRITGLRRLNCNGCVSLKKISVIPALEDLDCGGCISLLEIPEIRGIRRLNIDSCSSIKKISSRFKWLLCLDCPRCPLLETIPSLPRLRDLDCSRCTLLESLPVFPQLRIVSCSSCTNLKRIPDMPNLRHIFCHGSRCFISFRGSASINGMGPWFVPFSRLRKLKLLQKWTRMVIERRLLAVEASTGLYPEVAEGSQRVAQGLPKGRPRGLRESPRALRE